MRPWIFNTMLLGFALICMLSSRQARAAGFVNNGVGIRGTSMAAAFHGIATDASAVHYNPAGLALIEDGQMNFEGYALMIMTNFEYEYETPAGTTKHETDGISFIPGFFLSQSFDRWGLGFGFYIPYGGGGVDYKDFFQPSGDSMKGQGGFSAISLSGAVEIVRKYLSLGITPSIYLGSMESRINPPEDPSGLTRVVVENSGFAGFGGSLGIMSEPIPELKIGITLRSPVAAKMDGTITTNSPALPEPMKVDSTMEFTIPMELTLGFGSTPVPGLTLGLSGSIFFHGMMDEYTTTTTEIDPATGEEEKVKSISKTHYHHSFRVGLGAEYMFIKQLGVRGGIQFVQSATKDDWVIPISNDVNELVLSLGIAWNIVDFLALEVTGEHVFGFERSQKSEVPVPDAPAGTTFTMTERFDADHWVVLAGLRFNWDFKD